MAAPTHTGSFYLYANAGEIIAVGSVLPSLAIFAVAARLYTRHTHKAGVGLDDVLVAASLVSSFKVTVLKCRNEILRKALV